MKDKEKIKEQWPRVGDPESWGKNQWRTKYSGGEAIIRCTKKRDPYIGSRLAFWQWLTEEGDFPLSPLIRGKDGEYTLTTSQGIYYAGAKIKGKVVDFTQLTTAKAAAALLGKFHTIAADFDWHSHCLPQKKISRYLSRMENLLTEAEKACGKSSKLRRYWHLLLERAQRSLSLICHGTLDYLDERTLSRGTYVYGAVDSRGFISVGDELHLTHVSDMAEDSSLLDIWRLCRRYLSGEGDPDGVFEIIEGYEAEATMEPQEKKALLAFILFPYDELKLLTAKGKRESREKALDKEEKSKDFYEKIYQKGRLGEDENSH